MPGPFGTAFGTYTSFGFVGARRIPANYHTFLISKRVVADQKPAVLEVLPQGPHFRFKREPAFKSSLPHLP